MSATAVSERRSKQVNKSLLAVLIAFLANLLIAIAKSVAAAITSSASMLAEAAHSWADAGNEIFLLIADRRSDRGPDSRHPMGHGREAYVWSMFAAFGLFTAGGSTRSPDQWSQTRLAQSWSAYCWQSSRSS
jgi:divalent metal cation (Fe/Co/Zn/Cd) transporter